MNGADDLSTRPDSGHEALMELALREARRAGDCGEVPVGAVLALPDGRIFPARNRVIVLSDPTAHAEILAMRAAGAAVGNYRLTGSVLYSTIEPCLMCMSSAIHARVRLVVFGAPDPRWGGAGSLYALQDDPRLNHHPEVLPGVLADACRDLIQSFFREKRAPRLS